MDIIELYNSWGIKFVDVGDSKIIMMEECMNCNRKFTNNGIMSLHRCPRFEVEVFQNNNFDMNLNRPMPGPPNPNLADDLVNRIIPKPILNKPKGISCPVCAEGFGESTELIQHFLVAHNENKQKLLDSNGKPITAQGNNSAYIEN